MKPTLVVSSLVLFLVLSAAYISAAPKSHQIVERGPHHRVWQFTTETKEADGTQTIVTNSYTELATGLCYEDPLAPGRWLDTREEFTILPGRAVARFGPHQLTLEANINDDQPVVAIGPDGKRLVSKPWGLVFRDPATGQHALVAEVKDAQGVVVPPNTVLYVDAFTDCKAALRYSYTRSGCEQDVIFMDEGFGRPEEYGLKSETAVLEMWTEFLEVPEVEKIVQAVEGMPDETVIFGKGRIQAGKAFVLGDEGDAIPVAKTWVRAEGRTFLAEAVRYPRIRPLLDRLQAKAGDAKAQPVKRVAKVVNDRSALIAQFVRPQQKEQLTASMAMRHSPDTATVLGGPGVVLDYQTVNGTVVSQTFQGNETYYISGPTYLQNQTVFEPGAVLKYAVGAFCKLDTAYPLDLKFGGSPYRPVILTGKDDDSVGQTIAGSTGLPNGNYYANPALYIYGNSQMSFNLSNLRIRHAQTALTIHYTSAAGALVRHAQFVNCQSGLRADYSGGPVKLQNVLFHNVTRIFDSMYSGKVAMEHATVNTATWLNYNAYNPVVTVQNSFLFNVANFGSYSGSGNASEYTGTPFQALAEGHHYLAAGSPHRNQGTATIDPTLAADLKKMTTYPPLTLASPISVPTTLRPQAGRDTDTPDRGYHYWPLDYIADAVVVSAPLTLADGVALGIKGTHGLDVRATIASDATPRVLNRIASCQNVQEQGGVTGGTNFMKITGPSYSPAMRFRFTELSVGQGAYGTVLDLGGSSYHPFQELTFRDCWLRGGYCSLVPYTTATVQIGLTNNVIERSWLTFQKIYYSQNAVIWVNLYNNLFRHGQVGLTYEYGTANPPWYIKDNLFDKTSQNLSGTYSSYIYRSDNGFTVGTVNSLNGTGDVTDRATDFASGPLGDYYYPDSGPPGSLSELRNVGSRTAADADLSYYTTHPLQGRDAGFVDIGFHYAADADGDGLDDVSELRYGFNPEAITGLDGPNGDVDGDGVSNLREYQAGNSPVEWDGFANPVGLAPVEARHLKILSPTMLELVRITPDSTIWNFTQTMPAPDEFTVKTNGVAMPTALQVGFKRRPLFAPVEYRDLRVENALYLRLPIPIPADAVVEVTNPNAMRWPANFRFTAINKALRYNPAIHVNHEGYPVVGPKKAIIGYYCGNLGQMDLSAIGASSVKLLNAVTGTEVDTFNASARNDVGHTEISPQYQGLREVNFDTYVIPGEYRLWVAGLGTSFPFRIDNGVSMKLARTYALGLYHQRCGMANAWPYTRFVHNACHTAEASIPITASAPFDDAWTKIAARGNASNPYQLVDATHPKLNSPVNQRFQFGVNQTEVELVDGHYKIDVAKGHHDAGDYSKYTINSAHLIHALVFAADNFLHVGDLDNLGIPESGDGKGDILQEAKWEADFLVKMQDNGTMAAGGQSVVPGGFYTLVYPIKGAYEGTVLPDAGSAQIVWPKTTSVTAAAVGALAEIGSSPKFRAAYPDDADDYLAAAQQGWSFLMTVINTYGKRESFQTLYPYGDIFMHNDELVWAAAAMFAAGFSDPDPQRDPHTRLLAWYPNPTVNGDIPGELCSPAGGDNGTHAPCKTWKHSWVRMHEGYGCAARIYAFAARPNNAGQKRRQLSELNASYLSSCETAITRWGDIVRDWSEIDSPNSLEVSCEDPTTDVHNAYAASLITCGLGGYGWKPGFYFSSSWAFDIAVANQIQPTDAKRAAIIENLNYEAGRNPNNVSFLPGLGWKRQRAVVSQYAWNDDRILPPSGNPIGSVAFHFEPDVHNYQLNSIYYPPQNDDGTSSDFALYDRWADAYNILTEFVIPQTGRGLAVAALLAAETQGNRDQLWGSQQITAAAGTIDFQNGTPSLNTPIRARLNATLPGGFPLSSFNPMIVWDIPGEQPAFGQDFSFAITNVGERKVEAEAVLPDGRRVFGVKTFIVFDPINGGSEFPAPDGDVHALYRFNSINPDGKFPDSSSHNCYHLTKSGNVVLADNTAWMSNPSGKVARFRNAGDQLTVSIPDATILPNSSSVLKIEFRIYPRAYKNPPPNSQLDIFRLRQDDNPEWRIFYSENAIAPEVSGPTDYSGLPNDTRFLLSAAGWAQYVTLNTWHTIKLTLSSDKKTRLYIDDMTNEKAILSWDPNYGRVNDFTLVLGNFDGDIDELRISKGYLP